MSELPDLRQVTAGQQRVWSRGDFSMVANLTYPVAERLAEALDLLPGESLLDVACGSGNGAIAAARRTWGGAVGSDYVPALLERGRERAAAEGLEVEFVEADAQQLPFGDGRFDLAISIFGAMFAPDQERAAAELLRVVRPGGRVAMANWCPDGAVGELFGTIAKHAPPPPGLDSPLLWGTEARVRELFGDRAAEIRCERRVSRQPFRSPDHYIDFFRAYFGPINAAYERVGADGEEALTADLRAFLERCDRRDGRAMVLEAEYLEVLATLK